MASRLELHEELCELLGTRNVYFQPPESQIINYDCFVYYIADINSKYANNKNYANKKMYDIKLISRNPRDDLMDKLLDHFSYIRFDRSYISDNLYHFVFALYY